MEVKNEKITGNNDEIAYASLKDVSIAHDYCGASSPTVITTSNPVPINWEQRRYELIKAAMQGMMSNIPDDSFCQVQAKECVDIADEIIKELQK